MGRRPNIHPGEILREEFFEPMGISQYRPAKAIGVPALRISEMCTGKRSVSADTALRFSRAFSTTPGFWLGLQAGYDTEEAEKIAGDSLARITPLTARDNNWTTKKLRSVPRFPQ